ncbi:hypothetical protein TNCV_4908841 [Trichonephila clavipes]|uniref:Uncharacterized protein n=1 Tax=Trichonephila clavipes TaxID=2585209 RepID=A0A8X6RVG6_TRICX|nr:hypothetical protein TNCV_4908841 [Trichonephila clavipes]
MLTSLSDVLNSGKLTVVSGWLGVKKTYNVDLVTMGLAMFSDESRFSLHSDSRRTIIWRNPGTLNHQDNNIERQSYSGAGLLIWEESYWTPEQICMLKPEPWQVKFIGISFYYNM